MAEDGSKKEISEGLVVRKMSLGMIVIAMIMFFAALAIDIFWLRRLLGKAFPSDPPVDPAFYNAFAVPDIILSLLLYTGAYGLIKLRKFGFVVTLVAMGMWLFDSLLVLTITGSAWLKYSMASLFFALAAIFYLWVKKELFD